MDRNGLNHRNTFRGNSNSNHPDLVRNQPVLRPEEATPLIESDVTDAERNAQPRNVTLAGTAPLAKLENFEEFDDRPTVSSQPGVDDGFFDKPPILSNGSDDVDGLNRSHPRKPLFPYAPGFVPGSGGVLDMEPIPDVNIYQQKKTVAQGMMDLALFSANANQLRYVLENPNHPYYCPGIVLISISLIFQVLVGIGLILNTRYNVKDQKEICLANKINNFTIVGIFLVTVINVFISAFGVATNATSGTANTTPTENP